MRRTTLAIVGSILVAAVGVALIFLYVRGADQRAETKLATVTVLVAKRDIPAGTTLDQAWANNLIGFASATKNVAAGQIPANYTSQEKFSHEVDAGTILLKAMFDGPVEAPGDHPEFTAGQGLTLQLAPEDRADGVLRPGDLVKVWAVSQDGAKVVASRVRVVKIGTPTDPNLVALDVGDAVAEKVLAAIGAGASMTLTVVTGASPAAASGA